MTPNNILNMAMLNELDVIAITDHNSGKQLKVVAELAESYDFLLIYGMEVTVKEGFDVLCYFETYEKLMEFDNFIEANLSSDWGGYTNENQIITNIYDLAMETFDKPLQSTTLLYSDLSNKVRELNGAIILAHIDRKNQSPLKLYNLEEIDFDAIEIQKYKYNEFLNNHPELVKYKIFINSDSHSLLQISGKEQAIDLKEKTVEGFFTYLRGDTHE